MKLWKRTVLLMLVTLLCALIPVGTLSLYITGKRSLNNAAETYGRQLENGKILLEQFWDNSKYEQMSETGKRAYMGFQFQRCCGEGMALIDRKSNAVIENLTNYKVVGLENLGLKDEGDPYAYKIQKLGQKYLLLQLEPLSRPEGYEVLSVREVTGLFAELRQTAVWFLGIYLAVFLIAGLFIYMMMRRTVEQMEKLQEVAEKQELLMGALSHEMRTPLTSIIGYSDTLRHVKLKDEQKDRALEHINREGKRLEALSGKMLQLLGLYQNHAIHGTERARGARSAESSRMECEVFSMKMDPALMESLLINLIDNALKATDAGGSIWVRAYEKAGKKIFEVSDTGMGIPEEELGKITDAFYMVDKSRSRKEGGSGLGLALCVKVAEIHGGCLKIESRQREGTTVRAIF